MKKIVITYGTFDMFIRHLELLKRIKCMADELIVAVLIIHAIKILKRIKENLE